MPGNRMMFGVWSALIGSVAFAHPPVSTPAQDKVRDASPPAASVTRVANAPVIQIAILLDTSGSMEGLINQARSRVWDVVNLLATAKKNGQRVEFEVAVYQYGSTSFSAGEGYLSMIQPFTTDLDRISDRLFALQIGGSEEYCGQVIKSAMNQLSWSSTPASAPLSELPLRVMIVAGNEAFTQGGVDYRGQVVAAKAQGIIVNTIYCGTYADGESSGWLNAAYMNGGAYNAINHNHQEVQITCPQDEELLRLNTLLNTTYVPFGSMGVAQQNMQAAQDTTNLGLSRSGGMNRIAAKSTQAYINTHWDLVDATVNTKFDLSKVATLDLPENMRPMTLEARRNYLETMRKSRQETQTRIRELSAERAKFMNDQTKSRVETLDSAVIRAIRDQAIKAGFSFNPD